MKFTVSVLFFVVGLQLCLGGGPGPITGPGACTSIFHVVDEGTSYYLKSLCFINASMPQPDQVQYCANIGMRLYFVESAAEIPIVVEYTLDYHTSAGTFYLDAKRVGGGWTTSVPGETLNSAVGPIDDDGTDCIVIKATGGFKTIECTRNYNFICQFIDIA